jgi:hypothetical protein
VEKQGIFFLANDTVFELVIAFLNSLRHSNPDIPLCLIPYDGRIAAVSQLAHEYMFSIFDDSAVLSACDNISKRFHNRVQGQYRKLAMWSGKFPMFTYIDVDTVVMRNLDFAFEFLTTFDFITSQSHDSALRRWVWKDSIFDVPPLTREQIEFSANTGFIVSHKAALPLRSTLARIDEALLLAPHMVLLCAEQPLLNYLIVTSGKRYTSLATISRSTQRSDIPLEIWAGQWCGAIASGNMTSFLKDPHTLLVHWAGLWQNERHNASALWHHYRNLRVSNANATPWKVNETAT